MTEASLMLGTITVQIILSVIVFGLIWMTTGRDPLYWIAMWSIQLRAAIIQGWYSVGAFSRHFKANYPETVWQAREEMRGRPT